MEKQQLSHRLPINKNWKSPPRRKKNAEQKRLEKIKTKKRNDEMRKRKKTTAKTQAKTAKRRRVSSSENESEEDETPCMYCREVYSASIEGWISCSHCGRWSHNSCAGIDDDDDEAIHVCEFCLSK